MANGAISATDFIDAFRKQDWMHPPSSRVKPQALKDYFLKDGGMVDRAMNCKKFLFTTLSHLFESTENGLKIDELRDTAVDFYKNGLKVCPFQHCWFEWRVKDETHDHSIICIIEDAEECIYFQPFFFDRTFHYDDSELWSFSGWFWVLTPDGEVAIFPCVDGVDSAPIHPQNRTSDLFAINLALASMAMLLARETKLVEKHPPAGINAHRAKKGRAPLFSHHVVTIDPQRIVYKGGGCSGIARSSPRLHWRRGHVRTLSSGKKIGIPPCVVGAAENGVIDKTYKIKPPTPPTNPNQPTEH